MLRATNCSILTDAVLVVNIGNFLDPEAFLLVDLLLLLQNALVKELLKLLVTVVNAELFKTVHWEVFCNTNKTVVSK